MLEEVQSTSGLRKNILALLALSSTALVSSQSLYFRLTWSIQVLSLFLELCGPTVRQGTALLFEV